MLSTIFSLFRAVDNSPQAIDYFYMPPHMQWVPKVAINKTHRDRDFLLSVVGIHNLSPKVLKSIRIILPIAPDYDPAIEVTDAGAAVSANYDAQLKEVQITKLDPGERIYVAIFLSSEESESFTEPKIIINERLLSRGMRAVGFLKKRPKEAILMTAFMSLVAFALLFAAYAIYTISPLLNPKVKAIQAATDSFHGCIPTAYEKSVVNESLLAKHMLGEQALLDFNKVVTHKDLFDKDYVVICE